jgi:hypothetical protein
LPKFIKSYDTESRTALARLIDVRNEAANEAREAQQRIERLTALSTAAVEPRAALARLDAESAAAMAAWSRDPSLPIPAPDTAERTNLQRELAQATAKADAAGRAVESMRAEVNAAGVKASAAERELNFAAAYVALEELQPVIDSAHAAMAALASARMKGDALVRLLGGVQLEAGPTAPGFAEFTRTYAAAGESLKNAFYLPRADENAERAFMTKVTRLLLALRVDAAAKLED